MVSHKHGVFLPALPLASAGVRYERRLLRGASEQAVVRVLAEQRERYCQSGGQVPLSLTLDDLAVQLGLPLGTLADRQRTGWSLKQAVSRVNGKLLTQDLTIVSLHSTLGGLRYALFRLSEIGAPG